MKIKISNIVEYLFLGSCLLLTNIPQYLSIPFLSKGWNCRYIVFAFAVLSAILYLQNCVGLKTKTKKYCVILWLYFPIMLIGLLLEYMFASYTYDESIFDSIIASINFYYIFFIPVILYTFENHNGIYSLFERLNKISMFILVIYFTAYFLYLILRLNVFGVPIRFNNIRLNTPFFFGILLIYNFWMFIQFKSKKNLILAILILLFVFIMSGTRMEMLACVGGLLFCFVSKKRSVQTQFVLMIALLVLIGILYVNGIFDSFLASFKEGSSEYLSTKIRMEAIEYFNGFFNKNPFFGMGFLRAGINNSWDTIIYGYWDKYVFSDLGLYGFILKTGFCSLLLIGIPLIRILYLFVVSQRKATANNYSALLSGLLAYFLLCQISLSFTDVQRGLVLPIIWAVFEYCVYNEKLRSLNHEEFKKQNYL